MHTNCVLGQLGPMKWSRTWFLVTSIESGHRLISCKTVSFVFGELHVLPSILTDNCGVNLEHRFATAEEVVELKGRVACEITSADELVLSELVFGGVFNDSTVEQVAALLSCLVWQEKLQTMPKLPEELAGIYSQLREVARRVGKVQVECKVTKF